MKAIRGKNGILSLVSLPEARLLNRIAERQKLPVTEMDEQEQRLANNLFQQNLVDKEAGEETLYTIYDQSTDDAQINEDIILEGDEFFEQYGWVKETLEEAEYQGRKVQLNKPMQGDVKKFKVYVKDPKTGNVKKVNFGSKEHKIKKSNPDARRSFRARHKCDTAKDKTSARYWSCKKW